MGFGSFGVGIQGLSQGVLNGLQIGNAIKGIRKQNEIDDVTKKATDEANDMRTIAISQGIKPVAAGDDPNAPQQYQVGGKTYSDVAEAQKAAESSVGSADEFFNAVAAPKIRDAYVKQGNLEKAQAFDTWIQDKTTQSGLKHFSAAVRAAQSDDPEGFAKNWMLAYNTPGYHNDGRTMDGAEMIKDDKGNTTGVKVLFTDKDGSSKTQTFNSMDEIYHGGLGLLAPTTSFEMGWKENQAANAAKAKALADKQKRADTLQDHLKVEGIKNDNAIARDKANNKAAMDRTIAARSGGKPGGKDDLSPTGKTIRDLEALGVPREEAINTTIHLKDNPQKAAREYAASIMKAAAAAGDPVDPVAAYEKAYEIVNKHKAASGADDEDGASTDDEDDADYSNLFK